MGATDDDFAAVGLQEVQFQEFPEEAPSRFVQEMPPAAHLPFNSVPVRDWFFSQLQIKAIPPQFVGCIGEGPFFSEDFAEFLQSQGVGIIPIFEHTEVLILGRDGWDEAELDDAIDLRVGQSLKIYSQEMFLAFLAKGADPFGASLDVLEAFKAGHAGLEFVATGWSGWVTTVVPKGNRSGSQVLNATGWHEESPLRAMGYRVGKSGAGINERRRILRQAFTEKLEVVGPPHYMAQWGAPQSAERLRKMAESIAAHCRNNRAKRNPSEQAIADWEADLKWLREEFYHGHFKFYWPSVHVGV